MESELENKNAFKYNSTFRFGKNNENVVSERNHRTDTNELQFRFYNECVMFTGDGRKTLIEISKNNI